MARKFKGLSGGSLEAADRFIRGLLAAESFDRQALDGLHVRQSSSSETNARSLTPHGGADSKRTSHDHTRLTLLFVCLSRLTALPCRGNRILDSRPDDACAAFPCSRTYKTGADSPLRQALFPDDNFLDEKTRCWRQVLVATCTTRRSRVLIALSSLSL